MDTCFHLGREETCVAFNSRDCHACTGFRPKLKKTIEQNKNNKTSQNPSPHNRNGKKSGGKKKKKKGSCAMQTSCPNI